MVAISTDLTPNAIWPHATAAEVKIGGKSYGWVPIVSFPICPVTVDVTKLEFPGGLILFNDSPRQYHARTVTVGGEKTKDNQWQVSLIHNVGWPATGFVVLWD